MEVKPAYKQTELGVIPEDWDIMQLGDLEPFVTSGSRGWALYYSERGSLFVRITNLSRQSIYLDLSDSKFVKLPPEASEGVRTRLNEHDVLISITADIGIVGYVDTSVPTPAYINQHIALVRFDPSRACGKFVSYFLASERPQRFFRAATDVGAKAGLSLFTVQKIQTALPRLPEQRAIAEALSDIDGLLGGLDRLIAKKRDLKQAAMQQLLTGQTRLPGFHGEWEVKRLGDVGEVSSAGVDKKIRPNEVPVRLVNYLDVYRKDFIYAEDLNHWVTAPSQQAKRCAVQKGDVFFTPTSETRDDIGISAVAMEDIPDAAYSYHVARLRLREPWDLCFRTYAFKTRAFLDQAETLCDGNGTRYVISQGKFRSMIVKAPPTPEQTAIAEVLTEMDAELAALEKRREKTRALKQAMMQELLTGRIRLVSPSQATMEKRGHNWQINEAVIIGALALQFGTEAWPLPRKRRVKLTYLLHRHAEGRAEGYLKKAAGPYNPKTKYEGPEGIALKNGYVREHHNGKYAGLVAGGQIAQAEQYFKEWYPGGKEWVEQFRFSKTDDLEVLATVDMAMEDLRSSKRAVNLGGIKEVIRAHPEWEAKLSRSAFSDASIAEAISKCNELFMGPTPII